MARVLEGTALWRGAPVARLSLLLILSSLLVVAASSGGSIGVAAREALRPAVFAFAGDVMLGRGVAAALGGQWGEALSGVRPWLMGADVAFVNLRFPGGRMGQVQLSWLDPHKLRKFTVVGSPCPTPRRIRRRSTSSLPNWRAPRRISSSKQGRSAICPDR